MKLTMLKPRLRASTAQRVKQLEGTERISGNSLYAIMKRFERTHPRICAECRRQGLVGFGDELDHIIPLHLGGKEADANRQWLCREHHAEKTAREAGGRAGMLRGRGHQKSPPLAGCNPPGSACRDFPPVLKKGFSEWPASKA